MAVRVHSLHVSSMEVERKNSAYGILKNKIRNRMSKRAADQATRVYCNERFNRRAAATDTYDAWLNWSDSESDSESE